MSIIDKLRSKNLDNWLPGYARSKVRSLLRPTPKHRHLLFSICDHYEPLWGRPDSDRAMARVERWRTDYPLLANDFRDADGIKPRHSFFFPGEEYDKAYLDALTELVAQGMGEVELHMHHDNDTEAELRAKIASYLKIFASHGHLSRDQSGAYRYAFIHGNWCLANARKDGKHCGVDNEMEILFDTGCYADFTFPSPEESQPKMVNSIYWPEGDQSRRRAYDGGTEAKVGTRKDDRLLMVTGPLAIAKRPGKNAIRIESSAIDGGDPPTPARLRTWVDQGICVDGRPEWVFVKVHTHGAPEKNAEALLGEAGRVLHETLADEYNDGKNWSLHYVSAREMYNIALAAMDGMCGNPGQYRDYEMSPPPALLP